MQYHHSVSVLPFSLLCDPCIFTFFRFRPISVFREANEDESGFTCCAFSARERFLMLGTCTGQLKLYNVFSGQEEASYNCHNSAITHLEPSRVSNQRPIQSSRSAHSLSPGVLKGPSEYTYLKRTYWLACNACH